MYNFTSEESIEFGAMQGFVLHVRLAMIAAFFYQNLLRGNVYPQGALTRG